MNPLIRTIARREVLEMWRDGRFRWASGLLIIVLAASMITGLAQYSRLSRQQSQAQNEERERWLNKGEMSAHVAGYVGVYVYRPYLSTYAADPGIASYLGTYTHLFADAQDFFQDKPAEDEVTTRWIGQLSASVCTQVLAPLLIVVLGFGSFAGEREQGTLRQLASLGIHWRDLFLGKTLGVSVPLLLMIVPAALLGSAGIQFSGRIAS